MDKQLLTIEETAEILSLGKTKIYEFINTNQLIAVKIGKSRRVVARSIEDFVDQRIGGVSGG
jgi:excisionase family DNA binding protein